MPKKNVNFGQVGRQMPSRQTVRYDTGIAWTDPETGEKHGNVILHVKHTSPENKDYIVKSLRIKDKLVKGNEKMLKRMSKAADPADAIEEGDLETVYKNNDAKRELLAETAVAGWENVVVAGEIVVYDKEYCLDLLKELDLSYVDDLEKFCADAANFTDVAEKQLVSVEDSVKN